MAMTPVRLRGAEIGAAWSVKWRDGLLTLLVLLVLATLALVFDPQLEGVAAYTGG